MMQSGFVLFDSAYTEFSRREHIPGVAAGIVHQGELAHTFFHGLADMANGSVVGPHTLFRMASMTKCFTALAVLALRDRQQLMLDASAEMYVPELAAATRITRDSRPASVRDLLAHLAGDVSDDPWADRHCRSACRSMSRPARFWRRG